LFEWEVGDAAAREIAYGEMIRRRLDYEPHSGRLIWRDTGEQAIKNFRSSKGAEVIVDGIKVSAGRVVWIWHWGVMPPCRLRPANKIASDTRIENLGFYDAINSIDGAGFKWGICIIDRGALYPVAYFDSYYTALADAKSVLAAYGALTSTRYTRKGNPVTVNVLSPWDGRIFKPGEWEARDLV
jgi:hypothetical protein